MTASTWSGSNSESPIPWPLAARKVKHMPPPTTRLSTRPRRLSSTSSLSETLLPPSTAVNGRSGSSSSRDSLDLTGQQVAGVGVEPLGYPDHRGVGPVGGPEGVVHVDLGQGGEPVGQLGAFFSSPGS